MRRSTLAEWGVILLFIGVPVLVVWYLGFFSLPPGVFHGAAGTNASAVPATCRELGNGGFYQEDLPVPGPAPIMKDSGAWTYTLTPLYRYTMAGRIVGKDEYSLLGGNEISPMDITMANGDLISPQYYGKISYTKIHRAYIWSYTPDKATTLTRQYIIEHSSNSHLLFSDDAVWRTAQQARVGDYVRISGYLVTVSGKNRNGQTASQGTSTTRSDTGDHSCEVVYAERFEVLPC